MADLQTLLTTSTVLHDHLCPRQVLGVRMGMYAAHLLRMELPQEDKRLYTFIETDGCFADGIAAATGCWLGHRTIRLIDFGKIAATFYDSKTDAAIRIHPHSELRTRAAEYDPEARSRWHGQLDAYQYMPFTELFCVNNVTLTLSMQAIISRPGVRTNCEACGEEIVNEREVHVSGKVLCRACAGEGYYRVSVQNGVNIPASQAGISHEITGLC